jgi:hypothetical protein
MAAELALTEVSGTRPSTYYYFANMLFFRTVIGRSSKPLVRFLSILLCLLILLIVTCKADGILFSVGGVIGLFNDPFFFSLCAILPFGVWAIINLVERLEDLLEAIPRFMTGATTTADQSEDIKRDIEEIRQFVSLEDSKARRQYRFLVCFVALLFLLTQIINPFGLHFTGWSWALAPAYFPRAYLAACVWTLFWNLAICEICWFVYSVTKITFSKVGQYAKTERIAFAPLYTDQVEALSKIGSLAIANALFFSCGLIVLTFWVWKFLTPTVGYAYFIAYALGMVAIGVLPVWKIRNAIKKAKIKQLKKLGALFNEYLKLLVADMGSVPGRSESPTTSPANDVGRIALLEIAYARVEKMPIWPFAGSVRAIFSANMLAAFVTPLAKTYYPNLLYLLFPH